MLVGGNIKYVASAIRLSKRAMRVIKQNLFWAFFYNCIAIPVAAGALSSLNITLNPMIASACMSVSSLFVVTNALRLTRYKEETPSGETNKQEVSMDKKVISVEGMMCAHCVDHVTKALLAVEGVEKADVSLKKKTATVELSAPVSDETLTHSIEEAGYSVKKIK